MRRDTGKNKASKAHRESAFQPYSLPPLSQRNNWAQFVTGSRPCYEFFFSHFPPPGQRATGVVPGRRLRVFKSESVHDG